MNAMKRFRPIGAHGQQGLSLIELMIAMLLGLLVVGAAGGMFLSNKRVYGSTETLGRIQENQRTAFEIMSRDLREAGGNPCGSSSVQVSQIEDEDWDFGGYANGLRGYGPSEPTAGTAFGSAAGQRIDGTEAIDVHLTDASGDIRVLRHDNPSATLAVSNTNGLAVNDVVMVCNMAYSLFFQITSLPSSYQTNNGGTVTPDPTVVAPGFIQHNGGGSLNCSSEFQYDNACESGGASGDFGYCFMVTDPATASTNCKTTASNKGKHSDTPAQVVKLYTSRWYIGSNGRGGTSLYRAILTNNGSGVAPTVRSTEEIAEGVSAMAIGYRVAGNGNQQTAAQVQAAGKWRDVTAANVSMTFAGTRGALDGDYIEGTNDQVLQRTVSNFVMLRNREDKVL